MDRLKEWLNNHQQLAAWIVLAAGMVLILLVEARQVGLTTTQWIWLIIITTLVAGACVWIISWGDDGDEEDEPAP